MQTTRWIDKENTEIDKIVAKMINVENDDTDYEADNTKSGTTNWCVCKELDDNITVKFQNQEITYNYLTFSYDRIIPGVQPIEERTQKHTGFVIVYTNGKNVNYIIDKNSNALSILRKLIGYTGRKEIECNNYLITSDLFLWMIKKVFNEDNIIEQSEQIRFIIDTIVAFRGDSDDLKASVSAKGEAVMNLISTLSFLLESRHINQIKVKLDYNEHRNVELVLNTNGIIQVDETSYVGEYLTECNEKLKRCKLYLLVYVDIIPKILQAYYDDMDGIVWKNDGKIEFFGNIASQLTTSINELISEIQSID